MNAPDVLPKLLRMLGSTYDHEVLSAARKIQAAVIAGNLDWDQLLANGLAATFNEEQLQRVYVAGLTKGEEQGYQRGLVDAQTRPPKGPTIELDQDLGWVDATLKAAQKAETAKQLDEFETSFSESMRSKIRKFGRSTFLSQKQFDSLKRLEKKMHGYGYI